jgi:hypothetical protein
MKAKLATILGLVLALTCGSTSPTSAADEPLELSWEKLVPPAPPRPPKSFLPPRSGGFDLRTVPDDGTPAPAPVQEGRWMSRPSGSRGPVPVVESLDGKRVHIGGYVVPLDFDATTIKEFLLVPFVGACIHVPPPPANQIVYVKSEKGFQVQGMFDPVYVTGTLKVSMTSTGLADAGYSLEADKIELR